ncbi:hypothetical protein HFD88_009885 [Aspergillus terreus]|nr:hypothetical protein HFD88_009885 [Aspergillus terreus]
MSPDDPTSHRRHTSRSHRRTHSRSRSRSPDNRADRHGRHRHHRHRDRDHDRHHHHHRSHRHHDRREKSPSSSAKPVVLPFQARELSKRDLSEFAPMFAMYLDIQKGIIMEEISEEEVKGRWKSLIRKWNRGELAEGWYDPSTLDKARRSAGDSQVPPASATERRRSSPDYGQDQPSAKDTEAGPEEDDDEDEYGPGLPQGERMGQLSGPAIPSLQDLELRKELAMEDAIAARQDSRKQHREEVRSHRSELRHMEDEVAPHGGSNRAFAESRRGGSPTDGAPDDELMGSGENDLAAIKKARESEQRKKNEREIRREEILRARAAEREERLQQYRQKEEETIGWLKTLAKQRFG